MSNILRNEYEFDIPIILYKIYKLIATISVFGSIMNILIHFLCVEVKNNTENDLIKFKRKIFIIITIISALFALSTTTGIYNTDFDVIWQYGTISEWHTIGYTSLIMIIKHLFNNTFVVIIVNALLFIYFNKFALDIIADKTKSKKMLILYFSIIFLSVIFFDQLRYLIKDVTFSLLFSISILILIDYLDDQERASKKNLLKLSILLLILSFFRNSFIHIIIMLLIILIIYRFKKSDKRAIFYHIATIVSMILLHIIILSSGIVIKEPSNNKYTVPIYEVGYFLTHDYQFTDEELTYIDTYLPIDYIKQNFLTKYADGIVRYYAIDETYHERMDKFDYKN